METTDPAVLSRFLDPLVRSLTPEAARSILAFRADRQTQDRIDGLAAKCNEGRLTPEERQEYEAYVEAIDTVALLQAKAREALAHHPGP